MFIADPFVQHAWTIMIYRENYLDAALEHPWMCLLCDRSTKYTSESLIKFRDDWFDYESNIFPSTILRENLQPPKIKNPELRVFSAFDGISSGNLFLRNRRMMKNEFISES